MTTERCEMAKNHFPHVVLHRPPGRAYVSLKLPDGKRKTVYLGAWDAAETEACYREVLVDSLSDAFAKKLLPTGPAPDDPLVSRLVLEFVLYTRQEYRNAGEVWTNPRGRPWRSACDHRRWSRSEWARGRLSSVGPGLGGLATPGGTAHLLASGVEVVHGDCATAAQYAHERASGFCHAPNLNATLRTRGVCDAQIKRWALDHRLAIA